MLYHERGISIIEKLEGSVYELYDTVIDEYTHEEYLVGAAEERAQENAEIFNPSRPDEPNQIDAEEALRNCPDCEKETLSLNEACDIYHCANCHLEICAVSCEACQKIFPESEKYEEINDYYWCCEECVDASKKLHGCD